MNDIGNIKLSLIDYYIDFITHLPKYLQVDYATIFQLPSSDS